MRTQSQCCVSSACPNQPQAAHFHHFSQLKRLVLEEMCWEQRFFCRVSLFGESSDSSVGFHYAKKTQHCLCVITTYFSFSWTPFNSILLNFFFHREMQYIHTLMYLVPCSCPVCLHVYFIHCRSSVAVQKSIGTPQSYSSITVIQVDVHSQYSSIKTLWHKLH